MDLPFDPENWFTENNEKNRFYKLFNNWNNIPKLQRTTTTEMKNYMSTINFYELIDEDFEIYDQIVSNNTNENTIIINRTNVGDILKT
jgi:hypothetical protein